MGSTRSGQAAPTPSVDRVVGDGYTEAYGNDLHNHTSVGSTGVDLNQ